MNQFKHVTKEEFNSFVSSYPNKLDWDVYMMPEPPIGSHNDFTGGKKWPDSMVTKVVMHEAMKGHPLYKGEPNDYYILTPEG